MAIGRMSLGSSAGGGVAVFVFSRWMSVAEALVTEKLHANYGHPSPTVEEATARMTWWVGRKGSDSCSEGFD